jgi:hypothetical protein
MLSCLSPRSLVKLFDGLCAQTNTPRARAPPRMRGNHSHPNVVKLYGYCLEPPTVCLILELLPVGLNDLLYNSMSLTCSQQRPIGGATSAACSLARSVGLPSSGDHQPSCEVAALASSTVISVSAASGHLSSDQQSLGIVELQPRPAWFEMPVSSRGGRHCSKPHVSNWTGQTNMTIVSNSSSQYGTAHASDVDATTLPYSTAVSGPHRLTIKQAPSNSLLPDTSPSINGACPDQKHGQRSSRPGGVTDGASLSAARHESLSLLRVLQVATDVAAALAYLHSRPLLAATATVTGAGWQRAAACTSSPLQSLQEGPHEGQGGEDWLLVNSTTNAAATAAAAAGGLAGVHPALQQQRLGGHCAPADRKGPPPAQPWILASDSEGRGSGLPGTACVVHRGACLNPAPPGWLRAQRCRVAQVCLW